MKWNITELNQVIFHDKFSSRVSLLGNTLAGEKRVIPEEKRIIFELCKQNKSFTIQLMEESNETFRKIGP